MKTNIRSQEMYLDKGYACLLDWRDVGQYTEGAKCQQERGSQSRAGTGEPGDSTTCGPEEAPRAGGMLRAYWDYMRFSTGMLEIRLLALDVHVLKRSLYLR